MLWKSSTLGFILAGSIKRGVVYHAHGGNLIPFASMRKADVEMLMGPQGTLAEGTCAVREFAICAISGFCE